MIAIPAIDLLEGHAVRLAEGDRSRVTVYEQDPRVLVERFADAGAKRLHIVDLDGAFSGTPGHRDLIGELIAAAHQRDVQVEFGGGIRSRKAMEAALATGADFIVVGTLATREPEAVADMCRLYPGRVIVAIDGRGNEVAIDGWQTPSGVAIAELATRAANWGAAAVLYTDIARDGLQGGPAVDATATLQSNLKIPVIASGGVGSLDDLDQLRAAGVHAVVLGRALYEGSFSLEEALARC
ncbi:MAG: HisA/HisF-related TIM barrel protein [Nannocystaceae bacterium]